MRHIEKAVLGTVAFSIELELAIDRPSLDRHQRLEHLTGILLDQLAQHQLPATWALADPARSAASPAILAQPQGHEIAVLGERTWMGRGAGRLRIQRELGRRFEGARREGLRVDTLVLRNVAEPVDLELLLDHHIAAVSYPAGPSAGGAAGPLRFGVWHAPAAWRLPLAPKWWLPAGWQANWRLREAVTGRRVLHVAIDGDALVDQEETGLSQVGTILRHVARFQAQGKLHVRTLGALAAENLALRLAQPTRSLLAPAA